MLQAQKMQGFRSLQGLWPRARCCLWVLRGPICQPSRQLSAWSLLAYEAPLPVGLDSAGRREFSSATPDGVGSWNLQTQSIRGLQPLQQLVVTASGPDRPGIVARLSKRVLDCGGNVEESRMARLAGEFTILMLVTFDVTTARKAEQLRDSLLQIEGLQVNTRWTSDDHWKETLPLRKFRKILLRGADNPVNCTSISSINPLSAIIRSSDHQGYISSRSFDLGEAVMAGEVKEGLVYNVTEYLSSHGINIENLETYTQEAPFGGAMLFVMEGVIAMPVRLSTSKLIHNLDTLQTTLGVEIVISNLPDHHKFSVPTDSSASPS